jgi:hypothetical protein
LLAAPASKTEGKRCICICLLVTKELTGGDEDKDISFLFIFCFILFITSCGRADLSCTFLFFLTILDIEGQWEI